MVSKWKRVLAHLITPDWLARRHFRSDVLDVIEKAIAESELEHRGEIRFAVEAVIELTRVKPEDVGTIIDEHLMFDQPVARLLAPADVWA